MIQKLFYQPLEDKQHPTWNAQFRMPQFWEYVYQPFEAVLLNGRDRCVWKCAWVRGYFLFLESWKHDCQSQKKYDSLKIYLFFLILMRFHKCWIYNVLLISAATLTRLFQRAVVLWSKNIFFLIETEIFSV